MIKPSKCIKILLLEAYKLVKETHNVEDLGNTSFEDFIKAGRNYDFINKNLFLDNDLN